MTRARDIANNWAADITAVSAGVGITGGGTSGAVTVTNQMATTIDAKGDLVVGSGADAFTRLAVGTNEQRLVANSATTSGLAYVADTTNYAIGAKGDLLVGTAADTVSNLAVGSADQVLTVDSSTATGLKWATPVSGSLTLISEQTLSGASSVTFGSIPGTYKQLLLVWTGIYVSAASGTQWAMRLNNDSTTEIYSYNSITAAGGNAGSAISAANRTSNLFICENNTSTTLRNTSNGFILIDNYTSTSRFKPYTISFGYQRSGTLDNFVERTEGIYASTSAITSIDLVRTSGTGNMSNLSSTSLRLYGIN